MDPAEILVWVASLIAALGGIYITIHEVRRRERKVIRQEIEDLTTEVEVLQKLLLKQRRYIFKVTMMMTDAGLRPPQPPDPSFDPGEYDDENIDERKGDGNT